MNGIEKRVSRSGVEGFRRLALATVLAAAFGAHAEPQLANGVLTVAIDSGETRDYTAEELAAINGGGVTAIEKTGAGTLELRNELPTYTGTFTAKAGYVSVYATTNAFGKAGDGLVDINNACLTLNGTVIERPVYIRGAYNDNQRFIIPDGTFNRITGLFRFDSPRLQFKGEQTTGTGTLILSGGAKGTTFRPNGWGFLVITNAPLEASNVAAATFRSMTFAVAGNDIPGRFAFQWGSVLATVENAFTDTTGLELQAGGTFDLKGLDQRVGTLYGSGGTITSINPATLAFTQNANITNTAVTISGALSLHKSGSKTYAIAKAVTATGDLTVEEGVFAVTAAGSWATVGKVTVSGTGKVCLANAARLHDGVELDLADASMLEIENGGVLTCKNLTIGGVPKAKGGTYDVGAGKVFVACSEGARVDATWATGGVSDGLSEVSNWKGLAIAPDFAAGSLVPYFAETGNRAEVDCDAFFKGLSFGTADRFELAAADGVSPFLLGSLGMTFALPASGAATNVISAPMTLTSSQTWALPATSGETLEITGPIGSLAAADVNVTGSGVINLRADSTFTGSFKAPTVRVNAYAKKAFGLAGEVGHSVSLAAANNTFHGVVVEKPLSIGGGWNDVNYLVTPAGCTNVFKGPVTLQYGRMSMSGGSVSQKSGGQMRFEGGITAASRIRLQGWGEAVITNTPITAHTGLEVATCHRVELAVADNDLTEINLSYAKIYLTADRAICRTDCTVIMSGDAAATKFVIDGGFQQVGSIRSGAAMILARKPSTLAFHQTVSATNKSFLVDGPLSLVKTGAAEFRQDRSITATGTLDVAEGPFVFTANGSWLGATNVTVRGTGRVRIGSSQTFSRKPTDVFLSEDGVLELDEGVVQPCRDLYVNGKRIKKPGLYGGALSGDGVCKDYAARFDGKGALRVYGSCSGFAIIMK